MSAAVLFHGDNSLEFEDVRRQVLRIPEVISKFRIAQEIWDQVKGDSVDLVSLLNSENEIFYRSSSIKDLIRSVVQVALYERHIKRHGFPQFVLGNTKNESATLVAAGKISFEEMLAGSRALVNRENQAVLVEENALPNLRGQQLPQYQLFQWKGDFYESLVDSSSNFTVALKTIAEDFGIRQIVSIGPGAFRLPETEKTGLLQDLVCHESINMDPLLAWFWNELGPVTETA